MENDKESQELPSEVEDLLKKASREIVDKKDGYCFSIDNTVSDGTKESYSASYNPDELDEFINFDVLGEGDNNEPFHSLVTKNDCQDLLGDRKVRKILLDPGIGQVVPEDSIVMVHYIGYVENITEPFDVTYLQGKRPKRFTLGQGEMIPGLEIGIQTMKAGENARFLIDPELAYRKFGCPPRIPPNAHVLFDVHLVRYFSAEGYLSFNEDNRDPQRFSKVLNEAKSLQNKGNEQSKLKCFEKAIFMYERGVDLLYMVGCKNEKEEREMMNTLNKLYSNLCICFMKLCAFNKVCRMAIEAMKYSGKFSKHNAKIFYNWGKALRLLKNFSEAKYKLERSLKLKPYNDQIQDELRKLENDKRFNSNVELFSMNGGDSVKENQRLPPAFWEVFDVRLAEFVDSEDDILTVTLSKNPKDIEMAKRKANYVNLQVHSITKADKETNCIALTKIEK